MQVEQRNLLLVRIRRDALDGLFDAVQELVAETRFAPVEPVASLLEIQRSEAAQANRACQRGG
jgi:hypothetical protein